MTAFLKKNTGKWLEDQLAVTHHAYLDTGLAKVEKVEPPIRYVGNGGGIVALRNPFLDFIGAARGRTICMEAKSTEEPRLKICSDSGITERQWTALIEWEKAGAMCGVVWGHNGELRFVSMGYMKERLASGHKSMPWGAAEIVSQGVGFVLNDWLLNMRSAYDYPPPL